MNEQNPQSPAVRVAAAARSVGFVSWIAAGLVLPVASVLKAYGVILLLILLLIVWQGLAAVTSWALLRRAGHRRSFRYRLTGWGVVYGAIAATFVTIAWHWGVNLIYLTAAFLLAGGLCAALFPRLSLARTQARCHAPAHVFAGKTFPLEVVLRNERRLLSAFGLAVSAAGGDGVGLGERRHILQLAPGEERTATLTHYMPERGLRRLRPVAVSTSFPFGVVDTTMLTHQGERVMVLPRLGRIDGELLHRRQRGEARWLSRLRRPAPQGEFRSLREYKHGDNPRRIHWPTSARMKKLFVREFEKQEIQSVLVLLDAYIAPAQRAAPAPWRARFEMAVSFAATLAETLTRREVFYAFASFCPEQVSLPYDMGPGHLFSVLEALALARPTEEHRPADLLHALSFREVTAGGACLISAGPLPRAERAAALGPLGQNCACVDVADATFDEIFSY